MSRSQARERTPSGFVGASYAIASTETKKRGNRGERYGERSGAGGGEFGVCEPSESETKPAETSDTEREKRSTRTTTEPARLKSVRMRTNDPEANRAERKELRLSRSYGEAYRERRLRARYARSGGPFGERVVVSSNTLRTKRLTASERNERGGAVERTKFPEERDGR